MAELFWTSNVFSLSSPQLSAHTYPSMEVNVNSKKKYNSVTKLVNS